jgi:hypothetical protein
MIYIYAILQRLVFNAKDTNFVSGKDNIIVYQKLSVILPWHPDNYRGLAFN